MYFSYFSHRLRRAGSYFFCLAASVGQSQSYASQAAQPKGISLSIGLNAIDPSHYGSTGPLRGAENDARAMEMIAKAQNFKSSILLTNEATRSAVLNRLDSAAKQLDPGDIFMLTYSGHGGQVPDLNGDENDKLDETWCLYDGQLLDDELYNAWSNFKPGVRIIVISDSCHSGTVIKNVDFLGDISPAKIEQLRSSFLDTFQSYKENMANAFPAGVKTLDPGDLIKTFKKNEAFYRELGNKHKTGDKATIEASVILVSGCQDDQLSLDGAMNGLFTQNLLIVWAAGSFSGSHPEFHEGIRVRLPSYQQPNYFKVGKKNQSFEAQKPFTIT